MQKKKPEDIESPISVSVELQALRHSDNPEERSLGEFVSAIADLRTDIVVVEKRLSNPEALIPPAYIANLIESSVRRSLRDRDSEAIHEIIFRLEKLLHLSESGKMMPKELQSELARLREALMFTLRPGYHPDTEAGYARYSLLISHFSLLIWSVSQSKGMGGMSLL